jgi:hypothetical protein
VSDIRKTHGLRALKIIQELAPREQFFDSTNAMYSITNARSCFCLSKNDMTFKITIELMIDQYKILIK